MFPLFWVLIYQNIILILFKLVCLVFKHVYENKLFVLHYCLFYPSPHRRVMILTQAHLSKFKVIEKNKLLICVCLYFSYGETLHVLTSYKDCLRHDMLGTLPRVSCASSWSLFKKTHNSCLSYNYNILLWKMIKG